MDLNIHSGQQVAYKHNNVWMTGVLQEGNAKLNKKGLYLFIIPQEFVGMPDTDIPYIHDAEINDIFFDVHEVPEYFTQYSDIFMAKEDYIKFVETSEDFIKSIEHAYVSDGKYFYYPVNKYTRSWIEKQPFDYIVRIE